MTPNEIKDLAPDGYGGDFEPTMQTGDHQPDYHSLDEIPTTELLEMKDGALEELSDLENLIHRINQVLDSRTNGERPKLF